MSEIKTIEIKNQKVKYRQDGNEMHIFVYGTSNFKNGWLNFFADILCSIKCWRNKEGFHAGAYEAAEMILEHPGLLCEMQGKNIALAGHSMGGAVAECMGHIIQNRNIATVHKLFTFGAYCPCDDSPVFACWRIVQGFDKVPFLFPWFFRHASELIPTTGDGKWPFRFYYDHISYDYSCFWEWRA